MFYSNDDIQNLIKEVNKDDALKERILSHFDNRDLVAIKDVLSDGYYERFDRYDSDVCEQFLSAYEKER